MSIFLLVFQPHARASGAAIDVLHDGIAQDSLSEVKFSLHAAGQAAIESVLLIYGIEPQDCAHLKQIQKIDILPGSEIFAEWVWDSGGTMGFIPGMQIYWQWEMRDQSGYVFRTERKTLTIVDPAFTWRQVTKDNVTLFYVEQEPEAVAWALAAAVDSYNQAVADLRVLAPIPVRLTLYPSSSALHDLMEDEPAWAGGVAYESAGSALVANDPDRDWVAGAIAHEIMHLVSQMRLSNCPAGPVPLWLTEGLAVAWEGDVSLQDQHDVMEALQRGDLPALRTLEDAFPVDEACVNRAYLHSGLVVAYLKDTYGQASLITLLDHLRRGAIIDEALVDIYGLDTDALDDAWRSAFAEDLAGTPNEIFELPQPFILAAGVLSAAMFFMCSACASLGLLGIVTVIYLAVNA